MSQEAKKLRDEAAQEASQADAILNEAIKNKEDLTGEKEAQFDAIHKSVEDKLTKAKELETAEFTQKKLEERHEQFQRRQKEIGDSILRSMDFGPNDHLSKKPYGEFKNWLMTGKGDCPDRRLSKPLTTFALTTTGSNLGAELTIDHFDDLLVYYLERHDSVIQAGARHEVTPDGNNWHVATWDDTANTGELVAEGSAVADDVEPATGRVTLGSYIFSSKSVKVTYSELRSSNFDIESYLARSFAKRIGKIRNVYHTTGTGSSQPEGVVTGSSAGVTAASTSAVTIDELYDLIASLNRDYLDNAYFMFNRNTETALKKLTDGDGNKAWNRNDFSKETPSTILGYPYVINDAMANMGASAKSILFANFAEGFVIRSVGDPQMEIVSDKYKESLMVAYLMWQEGDSAVVNANAIKRLTNAAS